MEKDLKIPKEKRQSFAEPLDILIAGTRDETIIQVENIFRDLQNTGSPLNFYIVGDIVTEDFLANPFLRSFIKVCIIDEKTQRHQITIDFGNFFEEVIEIENPTGSINKDSWDLFRTIIKSKKRTLIKVTEGEEDLLILPLIMGIPFEEQGHFAFYGQPPITDSNFIIPEGIVIVNVDKNINEKVKAVVKYMEKV